MQVITDLHIHSKYSRATSKELTIPGIARAAEIKGVDVIATADITHPQWIAEIEEHLEEDGSGFLKMKDGSSKTRFTLFTEIANIYKKNDKARRLHTVIGVSSIAAAKKANKELEKRGYNLKSDGRPIIGGDVKVLMEIYLEADPKALIIPAHIWTPWFSVFGSKSGFDRMDECFEEMMEHIFAIETGLSSDPEMNWRVSQLNDMAIVSNSDAHSPDKIGREANVFDWDEVTYDVLYDSLKNNENLKYTIEFFPEEGKYHLDGHRKCGVCMEPKETAKNKGVCPKCGLPLVVGVSNRVEELADQTVEESKNKKVPFKSIVPLPEIIGNAFGVGPRTKRVRAEYDKLIEKVGNEFYILLDAPMEDIAAADPIVAEGVRRMREGQVHIKAGYDGEFGVITAFTDKEREEWIPTQQGLFAGDDQ